MHIDASKPPAATTRGAVSVLPATYNKGKFLRLFGLEPNAIAANEFKCNGFDADLTKFRWVIVQAQASCDFAQKHSGALPFYLGLEAPYDAKLKKSVPASVWTSPVFSMKGNKLLLVSARFPLTLTKGDISKAEKAYRIREELLNNLTYHIHTYAARPGITSFYEIKSDNKKIENKALPAATKVMVFKTPS
jgi:hypothetical protein